MVMAPPLILTCKSTEISESLTIAADQGEKDTRVKSGERSTPGGEERQLMQRDEG
jgi:hypothetical protein